MYLHKIIYRSIYINSDIIKLQMKEKIPAKSLEKNSTKEITAAGPALTKINKRKGLTDITNKPNIKPANVHLEPTKATKSPKTNLETFKAKNDQKSEKLEKSKNFTEISKKSAEKILEKSDSSDVELVYPLLRKRSFSGSPQKIKIADLYKSAFFGKNGPKSTEKALNCSEKGEPKSAEKEENSDSSEETESTDEMQLAQIEKILEMSSDELVELSTSEAGGSEKSSTL